MEFSAGLKSVCRFQNEIKLFETKYELVPLAKQMFARTLVLQFAIVREECCSY